MSNPSSSTEALGTPRIRPIAAADDAAMARIIRETLESFGCTGEGFAYVDPEVDAMSAAYAPPDAAYHVVECGGEVLGGGGFARLQGTTPEEAICELRKMYFRPSLRGRGLGRKLLTQLLAEMRIAGYRRAYLETTAQMEAARKLYTSMGFAPTDGVIGCTGHHGCDLRYLREL